MIIECTGNVFGKVEHLNSDKKEYIHFKNSVLIGGYHSLARSLTGDKPSKILKMLFGDGGVNEEKVREVKQDIGGLFGITRAAKPVSYTLEKKLPIRLIVTATLDYCDCNEFPFSEMGLELEDGSLYSMTTFKEYKKTDQKRITWDWELDFS